MAAQTKSAIGKAATQPVRKRLQWVLKAGSKTSIPMGAKKANNNRGRSIKIRRARLNQGHHRSPRAKPEYIPKQRAQTASG